MGVANKLINIHLKIAFGLSMTLSSAIAQASNWYSMGPTSNGGTDSVDLGSIVIKGNYVMAWFLNSTPTEQRFLGYVPGIQTDQPYKSTKEQRVFNCTSRESAQAQIAFYTEEHGQGKFLGALVTQPSQYSFSSAIPDTLGEQRLDTACKYSRTKKLAM